MFALKHLNDVRMNNSSKYYNLKIRFAPVLTLMSNSRGKVQIL